MHSTRKRAACNDCGNFGILWQIYRFFFMNIWLTWRMKAISYTWTIMSYITAYWHYGCDKTLNSRDETKVGSLERDCHESGEWTSVHSPPAAVPVLDFWGPYAKLCRWGGVVEEWMKRICPCLTPSRIALAEGARETVSLRGTLSTLFFFFFFFFFFKQETVRHSRYKIFT